jgi:hypothetical protein
MMKKALFVLSALLFACMSFLALSQTAYAEGLSPVEIVPDTSIGLNFDVATQTSSGHGSYGGGTWEWYPKGDGWCSKNGYTTAVLIIDGIKVTGKDVSATDVDAYGLRVPSDTTIIVRGVNTFTAGNATGGGASAGVCASEPAKDWDKLYITGDGTLNAVGKTGSSSYGIFIIGSREKYSGLEINCGKGFEDKPLQINATSGIANNKDPSLQRSWAIRCFFSKFILDNKNATLTTSCKEQHDISDKNTVGIEAVSSIRVYNGNIKITDCARGIDGGSWVRFDGGTVDITADGCAVWAWMNAEIKGGTIITNASVSLYSHRSENHVLIEGGNAMCSGFYQTPQNNVTENHPDSDYVDVYPVDCVLPEGVTRIDPAKASVTSNGALFIYNLDDVNTATIDGKSTLRMFLPAGTARFKYDGKFYYATVKTNSLNKFTSSVPALKMAGYQYGGVVSTPAITNFNETIQSVKYYCTTNEYDQQYGSAPEGTGTDSKALNAGTYYMYAVIDFTDSIDTSDKTVYQMVTSSVKFKVSKGTRTELPVIQTITGVTDTTFLFSSMPGYEYAPTASLNAPGSWRNFGSTSTQVRVNECHPGTKYYLHYRLSETENYLPSARRFIGFYTAYAAPAESVLTLNYLTEKITFDSAEYELFADAEGKNAIASGASLSPYISDYGSASQTLYVRKKSTSDADNLGYVIWIYDEHRESEGIVVPASAMTPVIVSIRPQPPKAISATDITATNSTLTVSGHLLDAGNEYVFAPASQLEAPTEGWKSGSEISSSDLTPGSGFILWQRVKAVGSVPSSTCVQTKAYTSVPDTDIPNSNVPGSGTTESGSSGQNVPHTGDDGDTMPWIILLILSSTGVLACVKSKVRFLKQHR